MLSVDPATIRNIRISEPIWNATPAIDLLWSFEEFLHRMLPTMVQEGKQPWSYNILEIQLWNVLQEAQHKYSIEP